MSNDLPANKQLTKLDQIQIESPTKHQNIRSLVKSQHKIPYPIEKQASTLHSSHHNHREHKQVQTTNSLYEETYYLTGLRQNYLVLISDNMHIIELPVGLLKSNITIGDPIKLKLQMDVKKAQNDRMKFSSVQENLIKQFTDDD